MKMPHETLDSGERGLSLVPRHCEPTGPRFARPDDRLREAIQTVEMAGLLRRYAPRKDGSGDSEACRRAFAYVFASVIAGIVALSAPALAASPAPPGASSCTGCHPANVGVETPVPRLAGRSAAEIVQQMQAFRSGQQSATVMDRLAKGFSDAEIQAIAAWYAAQK